MGDPAEQVLCAKQASSFVDYLRSYHRFIEGLPPQFIEKSMTTPRRPVLPVDLQVESDLRQLFQHSTIDCDSHGHWLTSGLGKGKGRGWIRALGAEGAVRIRFPLIPVKGHIFAHPSGKHFARL